MSVINDLSTLGIPVTKTINGTEREVYTEDGTSKEFFLATVDNVENTVVYIGEEVDGVNRLYYINDLDQEVEYTEPVVPATPDPLTHKYLDAAGVKTLTTSILTEVKNRTANKIESELANITVDTITENDTTHIPTAAAVWTAINSVQKTSFKVINNGSLPATGDSNLIYLVKDNDPDTTYKMYVYDADLGWIMVGDIGVDFDEYWRKDEIDDLKSELGYEDILTDTNTGPLSPSEIESAVTEGINSVAA